MLGTVFFFILILNLIGMLPWIGAATGAFSLTLTLATYMLIHAIYSGSKNLGIIGFWTNMIPKLDLPLWMLPLKIVICGIIFFVEVIVCSSSTACLVCVFWPISSRATWCSPR